MSIKNKIKAWFGRMISIDYCEDCGRHVKPSYEYITSDGDDASC